MRQTAVQITKRFRWTRYNFRDHEKLRDQENINVMVLITNEVREKQSNTGKKKL